MRITWSSRNSSLWRGKPCMRLLLSVAESKPGLCWQADELALKPYCAQFGWLLCEGDDVFNDLCFDIVDFITDFYQTLFIVHIEH